MNPTRWGALILASTLACAAPEPGPSDGGDSRTDAALEAGRGDGGAGCATPDGDGDGVRAVACGGTDCDDADDTRFPGNVEICDAANRDEDCDPVTYGARDADGDGHNDATCCNSDATGMHCGGDCDDTRRTVSPDSPEVCNLLDDDCDGAMDEMVGAMLWPDADGDMFGDRDATPMMGCPVAGVATNGDDCDDADEHRNPSSVEVCNGVDDDCDGELDGPSEDTDHDGHANDACAGAGGSDCDDTRASVNDDGVEVCDGLDNDCVEGADYPLSTPCVPCGGAGGCTGSTSSCHRESVGTQTCAPPGSGGSYYYDCDGPEDCPGAACCPTDLGNLSATCATTCLTSPICHTGADCASGTCLPAMLPVTVFPHCG